MAKVKIDKRFRKYLPDLQLQEFERSAKQVFNNEEYKLFLRKFRGSMIWRGNSSRSYKFYDVIRMYFKRLLLDYKHIDSDQIMKLAITRLIPVLGISKVKRGRRIQTVPILLKLRRKFVLMNKWLISSQKNKSNVRGIKINDITQLIGSLLNEEGKAFEQKAENTKRAIEARYLILRMKERHFNYRAFRIMQNEELDKLKLKYDVKKPTDTIYARESIPSLIKKYLKFLKYKNKFKKVKRMSRFIRLQLIADWKGRRRMRNLEQRWFLIWKLLEYLAKLETEKKFKYFDTKNFNILKEEYKDIWKKVMKKAR